MTTYNLRASNNATFRWTRDLTQFAATYVLSAATIRMEARLYPDEPDPPAYTWVTGATSGGLVTFNPATNLAVITAPLSDMAAMPPQLVYDARLEFPGGATVPLFGGQMIFTPGVTRTTNDAAAAGILGIGDTVSVDGETSTSPIPMPLSLSAAIAAAALSPASLLAVFATFSPAQISALQAIIGTSTPSSGSLDFSPITPLTVAAALH